MDRCLLCSAKRGPNTALHRFPKDPSTRASWIKFCGLNETTDDVSKLNLCSSHFLPSDYLDPRAKELGYKLQLKAKTVPSVIKIKSEKSHVFESVFVSDAGEGTSQSVIKTEPGLHEEEDHMPKKRRFIEPRYIGDIRTSDVATPREAKRNLFLAKSKINEQATKIRRVQQRNRRLLKKVKTLMDLINHLKKI